jgi:pyruvate dehydrogenase kinase 2/3/4
MAKRMKVMTYVPTHFRYMLMELLSNSAVATIRRHDKSGGSSRMAGSLNAQTEPLPDVQIIIAMGYEEVTIKISDQGGGISRSKLDSIWTFAHSTLSQSEAPPLPNSLTDPSPSLTSRSSEVSIRGFGLPLARIYARYFGGELTLKSMEGYGVDTYLQLPIFGSDCENLPDAVANSPGNTDSTEEDAVGQSWQSLLSKSL